MSFVDKVQIVAIAGDGGNGKLSFRHEKFIDKGGPDGGDGGHGANVVLKASRNQNTLATFRYQREIKAESGQTGGKTNKHGRSGRDLIVMVPVGTTATKVNGEVVADLTEDDQTEVVALGGRGGFGNAHFVSSRRQTPNFAEKGDPGEIVNLTLELKMIADAGLVGLPNAGKSTLLARISNARPEIADYPFTTLRPNLGVVDINKTNSVLFADIPGLIEGAAEGKGLGHDFLRHIERTAVIVHLIDAYQESPADVYETVKHELSAYQPELGKRPEIVVLTKIEGLDNEIVEDLISGLRKAVPKKTPIYAISSQSGQGIPELLNAVNSAVLADRNKTIKQTEKAPAIPILKLADNTNKWEVIKTGKTFVVSGNKIEQFARRTDFDNEEALQRLRNIMRRYGIMHELVRQGIELGQKIKIGEQSFTY